MKKFLLVLVAVFAMSAAVSAQVPTPFSFYAGGLVSIPNSPEGFSDAYKTGFHGFVGAGYNVAPNLQVVGKIEYNRFALDYDSDPMLATANVDGGHNNIWMYGADARYSFGLPAAPFKPYALGGLGFARYSTSELESSDPLITSMNDYIPEPQTDLYFNLGAGVEMKAGPAFSLFAQARYVSVQTEGEASAFIPISLGLKFF